MHILDKLRNVLNLRPKTSLNDDHLPAFILDGFHRHSKAPSPPLLSENVEPGQWVKIQVTLKKPLPCANYFFKRTEWLSMGGRVLEVISPDRVVAEVTPTTDLYPKSLEGNWLAILHRHKELEFPWVLVELKRKVER